jgi:sugar O-acyltransferase (sialic acid O-acetyltransferase NeuD family)
MPEQKLESSNADQGPVNKRALLIYGGGGHGQTIIDLVRAMGTFSIVGIVDDGLAVGSSVMDIEVLGGSDVLASLESKGIRQAVNAIGGIGEIGKRVNIFRTILEAGFTCPTLIHPSAAIEPSAQIGSGAQILPQAYVGTRTKIGFGVLINSGAIVSHDCEIGDYAGLAPGAILAGGVIVGEGAQIGMGVTINLRVSIGIGARIGNSAVIKRDVPAGVVVHAGQVWPTSNI